MARLESNLLIDFTIFPQNLGGMVRIQGMATITSTIPDADNFLAMPTQELAFVLLRLAQEHRQHGMIHPQALLHQMYGTSHDGQGAYPVNKREACALAFAEAWNWLSVQGLLIAGTDANGNNGHMHLSRSATKLLEEGTFSDYAQNVAFPRSLLHPKIAEEVWLDLVRNDLPTAVFKSFRAVEIAVREAGNFPQTEIGVALMRKAFHIQNGPLTNLALPEAEREALANLFAGAVGSYKNPHSHRTVAIQEPAEAHEMVLLASHLLRIVDSRKLAAA